MRLRIILAIAPLFFCIAGLSVATAEGQTLVPSVATGQDGKAKTFGFPLERGQYVFIGVDTGAKGKNTLEQGVKPLLRFRVDPNAVSDKWDLQVRVQSGAGENGEKAWIWDAIIRASGSDGIMRQRMAMVKQTAAVPGGKKGELRTIEKAECSKEKGVEGLQLYRIKYAMVEGEAYSIVVAVGNTADLFNKAFVIPQADSNFRWINMSEDPNITRVFDSPLQRGQYVFIGEDNGIKSKNVMENSVGPLGAIRIDPEAVSEKWVLQIAAQPSTGAKGEKIWNWDAAFLANDQDGSMHQRAVFRLRSTVSGDKKLETVKIEKVDASKEAGVEGLQLYKIPYAKVGGETYYIIVTIANQEELFPKAITLSGNYSTYSWHNWLQLK
jgi:hypothetical protein